MQAGQWFKRANQHRMTFSNECFPSYFTDAQLDAINDLINEADLSQAAEYVLIYDSKCNILCGVLTNNCKSILS